MDTTLKKIYSMSLEEIEQGKRHTMLGGGTPGPVLVKGKGVRIEDIEGKSYIDCTSQSWAMYLGFANEEVNSTLYEHMSNYTHVHQGFHTPPRMYLANKLIELAPKGFDKVSFTVGGGPAVEAALKIGLRNIENSQSMISLWDAYHGSLLTAASLSWIGTRTTGDFTGQSNFINRLMPEVRVPNPYCYRCFFKQKPEKCGLPCAEFLRETIRKGVNGRPAGFILEPVQASGGQIPLPKRYLQRVREICDEFNVPLIYDEIQTYCRIGEWFAATYYDVKPDIIVLGKGLGAGLPIAAILVDEKLEGFSPKSEELHTFANNSLSQVAAAKQIDIIERDGILENTRNMGVYLVEGLKKLQSEYPRIGDIRGVGLHIGVEFVKDPDTREIDVELAVNVREEGLKNGAIFGLGGANRNVLKVKPPLIVNQSEADEILAILSRCLKKLLG